MSGLNKPQDFAIIRHVWQLPPATITGLDKHFLMQTKITTLLDNLDNTSNLRSMKDSIEVQGRKYEVEFLNCGHNYLTDLEEAGSEDRVILLSFRAIYAHNLFVALVFLTERGYKNDNIPWLE